MPKVSMAGGPPGSLPGGERGVSVMLYSVGLSSTPQAPELRTWLCWSHLQSLLPQDVPGPQGLWIRMVEVPAHVLASNRIPFCLWRPVYILDLV